MGKKQFSIIGGIIIVLLVGASFLFSHSATPLKLAVIPTPTVTEVKTESITYKGRNGKDALTLLRQLGNVEQDKSGLVTVIKTRKAASAKHEYWAFYVNGKLAPVGPADYKTKDSDKIEWKIEKY